MFVVWLLQTSQEMFAHQYFDSAFPVWRAGNQAQLYVMQILPPGEFSGSGLSAPRRRPKDAAGDDGDSDDDEEEEEGSERDQRSGDDEFESCGSTEPGELWCLLL